MKQEPTLKRSLSLPMITFYGLGTILGAGIYVLVGEVAGIAGMSAPIAFAIAALVAGFSAFTYAELCARHPRSAGEAIYVQEGLRRRWLAITVGLMTVMVGVISAATISRGFVGYLQVFVAVPEVFAILLIVLALGAFAAWGITQSVVLASVITLVEVAGLLLVVWAGRGSLAELPVRFGELLPVPGAGPWTGILLAAFLAFYAYIGFEDMVNVAEEVKDVTRNLPRAILLALVISTILYMLVAVVAVLAVSPAELAGRKAPLAYLYVHMTGGSPKLISLFAVVNGALIQIIMASRILYGMSRRNWLPVLFGRVNPVTHTPLIATGLVTAIVLVLALWVPLITLARVTSFITLLIFALINLALLFIKHRDPRPAGIRVYPVALPVAGLLSSVALILAQLSGPLA